LDNEGYVTETFVLRRNDKKTSWGFTLNEKTLKVNGVKTGTPAAASPLCVGMQLLSVDSQEVHEYNIAAQLLIKTDTPSVCVRYLPSKITRRAIEEPKKSESRRYSCPKHDTSLDSWQAAQYLHRKYWSANAFALGAQCCGKPRLMVSSAEYKRDENGAYAHASSCKHFGHSILSANGTDTLFFFCQKCKSDFDAGEMEADNVAVLCFACNKDYLDEMVALPTRGRRSVRRRRS
jgi:hypothetical protein